MSAKLRPQEQVNHKGGIAMLDKYPRAQKIVSDLKMESTVPTIKWLQMDNETAGINLAKVLLTKNALQSASIPLRKLAADQVDKDYKEIGSQLHVFAKEEGRFQVNLTNEGVTKLYAHIELGGSRYRQREI